MICTLAVKHRNLSGNLNLFNKNKVFQNFYLQVIECGESTLLLINQFKSMIVCNNTFFPIFDYTHMFSKAGDGVMEAEEARASKEQVNEENNLNVPTDMPVKNSLVEDKDLKYYFVPFVETFVWKEPDTALRWVILAAEVPMGVIPKEISTRILPSGMDLEIRCSCLKGMSNPLILHKFLLNSPLSENKHPNCSLSSSNNST